MAIGLLTTGINMLRYWTQRRGITNLIYRNDYSNAFAHLYQDMETNVGSPGTK